MRHTVRINKVALLCFLLLLSGGWCSGLQAQQRTLKGTVADKSGSGIVGASVIIKGSLHGTITNVNGAFNLQVPRSTFTLTVACLGYTPQDVQVSESTDSVKVTLQEFIQGMEDVVVVAFAQQKKINVTGAISTVGSDALMSSASANVTSALLGNTVGVTGLTTSGEPGQNATDIKIRGVSTYGSSRPLVVIDGVEQASEQAFEELNAMDPNEIAGISILKDAASTAVYGIRGANGVIIVTTKRGTLGKPTINFSANFGLTWASQLQKGTSSYEYAKMRNEAILHEQCSFSGRDGLSSMLFSDDDLWKFKNNRDYTPAEVDAMNLTNAQKEALKNSPALYYASHDLYKEQFDRLAPQYQANLNIRGGTERVKYFVSIGYFRQEGITHKYDYYDANSNSNFQRYNFRSNFDIQVAKNVKVSVNSSGQFGQNQGPGADNNPWDLNSRYATIMRYIYDCNPASAPGIVDGHLIGGYAGAKGSAADPLGAKMNSSIGGQNPVYNLLRSGMSTLYNSLINNSIRIDHSMDYLLRGLNIHATVNYQNNYNRRVVTWPTLPIYTVRRNYDNPAQLDFFGGSMDANSFSSTGWGNWNKIYLDAGIDWSGSFKKHNISALLLGKASRYTMPESEFNVPSGIVGFVGRVTYNYDNRYMAELNAGYNGTEQFAKGNRFGFFPAISIGWVPSMEPFFPKNDILTFLKIRASYGEVGNDDLGNSRRFFYLPSTYANTGGYYLGFTNGSSQGSYFNGIAESDLGYSGVTWERAKKYDVGIELKFFKDRLSVSADWYREDRNSILTTLGIVQSEVGVSQNKMPPANVGVTKNQGFEVVAGWTDHIGKVGYTIDGDFSFARNKIIYKAEAPNPYSWMNSTGFGINQRFGYISDGLYNTPEELQNRPVHSFCADQVTLGDIRYKDLNGDGVIDNKDVAPIGYSNLPEIMYNMRISLNYKGFNLRILFSAAAHSSYYLNTQEAVFTYYKNAGNAWKWQYDGRWTPEKYAAGEKITYPRAIVNSSSSNNNFAASDYWMVSSNYFKIKNIELGYTFQMKGNGLSALRVYTNASNLFTFGADRLREIGIDPESKDGSQYVYPLTRIVNLGVSLQF